MLLGKGIVVAAEGHCRKSAADMPFAAQPRKRSCEHDRRTQRLISRARTAYYRAVDIVVFNNVLTRHKRAHAVTEQDVRQRPIGLPHYAVQRMQIVDKITKIGKVTEITVLLRTSAVTDMVVSADDKARRGHSVDKALTLVTLDIFAHTVRDL